MATSYEIVYGRFLNSIKDFNLIDLDDHTLNEMLKDWLHKAIVRTRTSSDLTARDEIAEAFDNDLTDLDIELLAMGMTLAWLEPTLKSTELTLQFIGGKEEKYYSQANHIAELRALREDTRVEMKRIHCYGTYANNSYFDD
jgi:hypothetical protein